MFLSLKIITLVFLIRLLLTTDQPFLCSGVYTIAYLIMSLALGAGMPGILIGTAVALVLSSLYFWLLYRFDGGVLWWIICIGGFFLGLV